MVRIVLVDNNVFMSLSTEIHFPSIYTENLLFLSLSGPNVCPFTGTKTVQYFFNQLPSARTNINRRLTFSIQTNLASTTSTVCKKTDKACTLGWECSSWIHRVYAKPLKSGYNPIGSQLNLRVVPRADNLSITG